MKFHHRWSPWKNLLATPWKNPLLIPLENPSDARGARPYLVGLSAEMNTLRDLSAIKAPVLLCSLEALAPWLLVQRDVHVILIDDGRISNSRIKRNITVSKFPNVFKTYCLWYINEFLERLWVLLCLVSCT